MRYERKYRLDAIGLEKVKQYVNLHPASFKTIYPDRTINNVYFDTPALNFYRDNMMGVARRKKYRLRWYGEELVPLLNTALEVKIRDNEMGRKDRIKMGDYQKPDWRKISYDVNDWVASPSLITPVLINSYRRSYFGTGDGKFRLTVDFDLSYYSLMDRIWTEQKFDRKYFREFPGIIVELKYDKEHAGEADFIQQNLPFRISKNSKYVNGMSLLYG